MRPRRTVADEYADRVAEQRRQSEQLADLAVVRTIDDSETWRRRLASERASLSGRSPALRGAFLVEIERLEALLRGERPPVDLTAPYRPRSP